MYRFGSFSAPSSPSRASRLTVASRGEALQSLIGADGLRDRFFAWCGASGRRYVCSVFQAGESGFVADVTDGLLIGVVRDGDARPVCLFRATESARMDDLALRRAARELGVAEWHVLFGADETTMQDLAGSLLN